MRTLLVLFLFTAWVQAQDLDTFRSDYDVIMAELDLPVAEWHQKYVAQLKQLQAQAQQAGDLNQLLVIKQELDGGAGSIDPRYTALKRLRGIYDRRLGQLEQSITGKRRQAMLDYGRKLTAFQAHLTKGGKIEEALKVKEEIQALEIEMGAASIRQPAGGLRVPGANTRPGRLVIYGKHLLHNRTDPMILPASSRDQAYVRVFANGSQYYAVDPEGGMIGKPNNHNDHIVPKDLKPVLDVGMGTHISIILHPDGTITPTPNGHSAPLVPKLEDVIKVSAGYNLNCALKRTGEFTPFGYILKDTAFNNPRLLNDVVDFGIANQWVIVKKRNGSVMAGKADGEMWEDPPEGLAGNVVKIIPASSSACLFLLRDGSIVPWRTDPPPEDLGPVRQLRAGSDVFGAQKPDGTWVTWGKESKAEEFNQQLERLGPLKDFALGHSFFIAIK